MSTPTSNMVDWLIKVFKIIALFNGNLVLATRLAQFTEWVEAYNSSALAPILLNSTLVNVSLELKSGWFSGSVDTEKCFNVGGGRALLTLSLKRGLGVFLRYATHATKGRASEKPVLYHPPRPK
jgi:hypothetical protein|uniref:Uncharacterized protein n=1 Tax=Gigaspora rosea TaxID=44941 RepID=H9EBE2_9GLOM|nr:hypothetical protein GiroM_p24 [Gigaspora rosea]AFD04125.1 hypothetical protein [Gigaspora rosea]